MGTLLAADDVAGEGVRKDVQVGVTFGETPIAHYGNTLNRLVNVSSSGGRLVEFGGVSEDVTLCLTSRSCGECRSRCWWRASPPVSYDEKVRLIEETFKLVRLCAALRAGMEWLRACCSPGVGRRHGRLGGEAMPALGPSRSHPR